VPKYPHHQVQPWLRAHALGGVAVEHLVDGSPEAVSRDAERAILACKPGGRFIFGSSHSIAVGTRWENFQAMLEVWRRESAY